MVERRADEKKGGKKAGHESSGELFLLLLAQAQILFCVEVVEHLFGTKTCFCEQSISLFKLVGNFNFHLIKNISDERIQLET